MIDTTCGNVCGYGIVNTAEIISSKKLWASS